jgi:hypothetical protein
MRSVLRIVRTMSQTKKSTLDSFFPTTSSPKKRSAAAAGLQESAAKLARGEEGNDVSTALSALKSKGFDMKDLGLTPFGENIVNGLLDDGWKETMTVLLPFDFLNIRSFLSSTSRFSEYFVFRFDVFFFRPNLRSPSLKH